MKVFGASCQYCPMEGAEHKRGSKTEWGWFVGMQLPMCLVLRPEDSKVLSVSRKKIMVHEECYAKFGDGTNPLAHFVIPVINLDQTRTEEENLEEIKNYKDKYGIPDHVLSVKALSDFKKHPELNTATPTTHPPNKMLEDLGRATDKWEAAIAMQPEANPILWHNRSNQQENQGEITKPHVPDHAVLDKDLWLDKIREFRRKINQQFDMEGRVEAIVKGLKKAEEEMKNVAPRWGHLKKKIDKYKESVHMKNVLGFKRKQPSTTAPTDGKESIAASQPKKKIDVGDRVKIRTLKFGKAYAEGLPKFTYGYVKGKKGDLFEVLWDAGDTMMTHKRHLIYQMGDGVVDEEEPVFNGKINKNTILPILSVGTALSPETNQSETSWPKDFYEALLRED
jgi:hypothetical protein